MVTIPSNNLVHSKAQLKMAKMARRKAYVRWLGCLHVWGEAGQLHFFLSRRYLRAPSKTDIYSQPMTFCNILIMCSEIKVIYFGKLLLLSNTYFSCKPNLGLIYESMQEWQQKKMFRKSFYNSMWLPNMNFGIGISNFPSKRPHEFNSFHFIWWNEFMVSKRCLFFSGSLMGSRIARGSR
jgi:hypothetical protein